VALLEILSWSLIFGFGRLNRPGRELASPAAKWSEGKEGAVRGGLNARTAAFHEFNQGPDAGCLGKTLGFLFFRVPGVGVTIEYLNVGIKILGMSGQVSRPGVFFGLSGAYFYDGYPAMEILFYLRFFSLGLGFHFSSPDKRINYPPFFSRVLFHLLIFAGHHGLAVAAPNCIFLPSWAGAQARWPGPRRIPVRARSRAGRF
jgi:hypothetical protein